MPSLMRGPVCKIGGHVLRAGLKTGGYVLRPV